MEDSRLTSQSDNTPSDAGSIAVTVPDLEKDVVYDINDSEPINQGESQNQECTNDFLYEIERRKTFSDWTTPFVHADDLAKTGFVYLHKDDHVQCAFCNGIVGNWEAGDVPRLEHLRLYPNCPFLTGDDVGNVPKVDDNNILASSDPDSASSSIGLHEDGSDTFFSNSKIVQEASQNKELVSKEDDANNALNHKVIPNSSPSYDTTDSRMANQHKRKSGYSKSETNSRLVREDERLKTFLGWEIPHVTADDMARTGFVCLRDEDHVECVFCTGIVGNWEEDDIPSVEHQRYFPDCPFLNGENVGNIPILSEESPAVADTSLLLPPHNAEDITSDKNQLETVDATTRSDTAEPTEITNTEETSQPNTQKFPKYATVQSRLDSFSDQWSPQIPQTPKILSAAGFYFTGISDQVQCFNCGGGLRNWEDEDNPWLLHLRLLGNCSFLKDVFTTLQQHREPCKEVAGDPPTETPTGKLAADLLLDDMKNYFESTSVKDLSDAFITTAAELEQCLQHPEAVEEDKEDSLQNQ